MFASRCFDETEDVSAPVQGLRVHGREERCSLSPRMPTLRRDGGVRVCRLRSAAERVCVEGDSEVREVPLRGASNPNWKGGITPENKKIRASAEYKAWRTAVFERDGYTCVACGQRGGTLHADHIQPFCAHPELRLEVSNGRTLCFACHAKTPTFLGGAARLVAHLERRKSAKRGPNREQRIASGLCRSCSQPRADSGSDHYCKSCLAGVCARQLAAKRDRISLGLCCKCGGPRGEMGTKTSCRACADRKNGWAGARAAIARARTGARE